MTEEQVEQLVNDVCDVITAHNVAHLLSDYGTRCTAPGCQKSLYGAGAGMTLSRHRAEKIVDTLLAKGLINTAALS